MGISIARQLIKLNDTASSETNKDPNWWNCGTSQPNPPKTTDWDHSYTPEGIL
jgi:hypothetical protein